MLWKTLLLSVLLAGIGWGQGLPDRDELVAKFLNEATSDQAAKDLVHHFQMGGLRTIIRNLNGLPYQKALGYGESLRHTDLSRFANDLNTNLNAAQGEQTRAMYLMLLAKIGRQIDPSAFEPYIGNTSAPLYIRLAAASAVIKIQNPKIYDRFHELADQAIVDPGSGKDDLKYADLTKENIGFYLYSKSKLENSPDHGVIVSVLAMVDESDTDVYQMLLDDKQKKYIPLMIDRAIQVGGVRLLETMSDHKTAKKLKDEIAKALGAAREIAKYSAQFAAKLGPEKLNMGPVLPVTGSGNGSQEYRSGYAVVKIDASGKVEVPVSLSPFGGASQLKSRIPTTAFPAHDKQWQPVETCIVVYDP